MFHKEFMMERQFSESKQHMFMWCDVHKADRWQSSEFQPHLDLTPSIKDNSPQISLDLLRHETFKPLSRWGLKSDGAIGFKNKAGRIYASEVLKCLARNWALNHMGRLSAPKVVEKDMLYCYHGKCPYISPLSLFHMKLALLSEYFSYPNLACSTWSRSRCSFRFPSAECSRVLLRTDGLRSRIILPSWVVLQMCLDDKCRCFLSCPVCFLVSLFPNSGIRWCWPAN